MSTLAAVSATGYLTETASATMTTGSDFGYGAESFGAYGYGGVETTN